MKYSASPTVQAFMDSRAFIKGLMGPVGGGKSTGCMMELLFERAMKQEAHNGVRRTKFAILRNTSAQLKATVKPLLDEWFVTGPLEAQGRALGEWRLTDMTFEVEMPLADGTRLHSEFCLLAADTPDDVRRLLSLQLSAAWVEEAREIDADVFKGLLGRVGRFPSRVMGGVTYPGVIFSTNAPMLNTFWHEMIVNPPENAEVFVQPAAVIGPEDAPVINPAADNLQFLIEGYYDNLLAANSAEWVDVYLRNNFGIGNAGQAVYKATFKKDFHVAKLPITPMHPGAFPLIVGMDNGLQAALSVLQQDVRGRVMVLGECFVPDGETMGVETFLDRLAIPYLLAKFPNAKREHYTFVLDPACFQRSQVDEKTIAQAVAARGFKTMRAVTNDPEKRQLALEGLLNRAVDGKAGLMVDPGCTHIANGLEWGFRYKKAANGQTSTTRDKSHHSHCFPAGVQVLTPHGSVGIETLTVGDMVATPQGPCRVAATMSRMADELVELWFDSGTVVRCTPDHPFISHTGVVRADALEYSHVIPTAGALTCQKDAPQKTRTASTPDANTTSTPTATTQRAHQSAGGPSASSTASCGLTLTGRSRLATKLGSATATAAIWTWLISTLRRAAKGAASTPRSTSAARGTTTNPPATTKPTSPAPSSTYTGLSGWPRTALFPRGTTSTTKTGTVETTRSKILSFWKVATTCATTWLNALKAGGSPVSLPPSAPRRTGTVTRQITRFTSMLAESLGRAVRSNGWSALSAPPSISAFSPAGSAAIAAGNVWRKPDATAGLTTSTVFVGAVRRTGPTSTAAPAGARLVARRHLAQKARVYDLTVADAHVFYANGLLVHNCVEALEYAAMHYNAQIAQEVTAWQSKAREIKRVAHVYV